MRKTNMATFASSSSLVWVHAIFLLKYDDYSYFRFRWVSSIGCISFYSLFIPSLCTLLETLHKGGQIHCITHTSITENKETIGNAVEHINNVHKGTEDAWLETNPNHCYINEVKNKFRKLLTKSIRVTDASNMFEGLG